MSHRLIMEKGCLHATMLFFYQIIIKIDGNQDRHKNLKQFDIGHIQTADFLCPETAFWRGCLQGRLVRQAPPSVKVTQL